MDSVDLRCRECGVPFATLQNGAIVVESRHHGKRHVNAVSVADLLASVCRPGELQEVLELVYELRERFGDDDNQDDGNA